MKRNYLENIKILRTEKNISQNQMAVSLGFTQNNYSKIERGLGELTVDRLYEIAEILGVSVFQILIDKDVEILQEKIRIEIETKQRQAFNDKEIERIKEKYKEEFENELTDSIKKWLDDAGTQIAKGANLEKNKTKEERDKITNDRFEGYKK